MKQNLLFFALLIADPPTPELINISLAVRR
jgi:hypothetical protein